MKEFVILAIAFAILSVAFAVDGPETEEKETGTTELGDSGGTDVELLNNKDRKQPNRKQNKSKQAPAIDENKTRKDEDDLLNVDMKIKIPSINSIYQERINPIDLGKKISQTSGETMNDYINQLKSLVAANPFDTKEGKFYRAALAAVKNPQRASKWWQDQMEASAAGVGLEISDVGKEIRRFGEADPLGTFAGGVNAVVLSKLSDHMKNAAKTTDLTFDTLENGHRAYKKTRDSVRRKVRSAVNQIPLFGPAFSFVNKNLIDPIVEPIEGNLSDGVDTVLAQGRFLLGKGFDDASQNYGIVRDDAMKTYTEKEKKLQETLSQK